MEEYILEYLFQKSKDGLIKGNDYPVLIYLFEKSYHNGFCDTVEITAKEAKDDIGMTSPTFKKCLESLSFSGIISTESFSGRNGYTSVTLDFIKDMNNISYITENSKQTAEDVLHNHCPNTKTSTQVSVTGSKNRAKKDELNYKEILQFTPLKYKDSLQYRLENIKKFYNLFFLNIKELYNLDAKYKTSLPFKPLKYKVSLHFMSDAKSLNIKDLDDLDTDRFRDLRSFLAKSGTIYSRNYIKILNTIDTLIFDGNLLRSIQHYVIEDKSKKKSSKYHLKEFELNEETDRLIPLHLQKHSEYVNGEEITFKQALQNWLNYKKAQGKPPVYDSILKNINWLATIDNPVESIETSIRKEANGIFKVDKNFNTYGSSKKTADGSNIVGRIKRFE